MFGLRRSTFFLSLCAIVALALGTTSSPAQTPIWPQRPVHFILPFGPGAGVDITARLLADKLSAKWGQPVVVENRPGGDAIVAIQAVLDAHDDHVLLFAPASAFTAHAYLHDTVPYNPDDLIPIARVTNTIIGLAVPTSLNIATMKDFVAKVRAEPGKLNYASVTGANDLLFESFLKVEKLEMAKVPYKDPVQAVNDLAEGRIHAYVAAYAIERPQVANGKIKVLALTNPKRAPSLPDIPTAQEAGFKSLTIDGLTGLFASPGMPLSLRERIAADIRGIVVDPAVSERLTLTGQVVNPGTPQEFAAAIADQRETVAEIGKTLGIKPAGHQ
jgi:tripartite-type tricarboxylate transporter receptor subunit TctC